MDDSSLFVLHTGHKPQEYFYIQTLEIQKYKVFRKFRDEKNVNTSEVCKIAKLC